MSLHNCSSLSFSPPPHLQLPDKHGITALLAAVYEDHEDCVRVLVRSVSHCRPNILVQDLSTIIILYCTAE